MQGPASNPRDLSRSRRGGVGVAQDVELVPEGTPAGSLCGGLSGSACVKHGHVIPTPNLLQGRTVRAGTLRKKVGGPTSRAAVQL